MRFMIALIVVVISYGTASAQCRATQRTGFPHPVRDVLANVWHRIVPPFPFLAPRTVGGCSVAVQRYTSGSGVIVSSGCPGGVCPAVRPAVPVLVPEKPKDKKN